MSLLSDKILEDVDKMPYHSKKDFMADYCGKYNCADADRAEELKAREDLLILAVKMMKGKGLVKDMQEYILRKSTGYIQEELNSLLGQLLE